MASYKINPHIQKYIDQVRSGAISACNEQLLLADYILKCFATEDIYTDDQQLDDYLGLAKYFPFEELFTWEEFCVALHLCTYWRKNGRPRWPDLFMLIGRGAGKDGFIAFESMCLISPYSNLPEYDVDICANVEEQAMRPVKDVYNVLENVKNRAFLKKFFRWTMEQVTGIMFRGVMRGRTNSPRSKDGMRSGMVVFNEIHQYLNYDNIKVFITGLGKKKHPRRLYATTNGDVREGPLDDYVNTSLQILNGETPDNGFLPFICRLNSKEDASDPDNWPMANPSLPYREDLRDEIAKEYIDYVANPIANSDFMTKRMNLPQTANDQKVTEWENILATNKPLPDLTGWKCTVGIDYASIRDWASIDLHFRKGDQRFDINHSWLCIRSQDLFRLKVPWREWAEQGYITLVDDVEIPPEMLMNYITQQALKYQISNIALDNFRYALLASALFKIGFDAKEYKNVKLVHPGDIMKIQPVIDSAFNNQRFTWGDYPPLRWATNNTKLMRSSRDIGSDTGNIYYAKIEGKSRKTDPFMALVASMVIEEILETGESNFDDLPVIIG